MKLLRFIRDLPLLWKLHDAIPAQIYYNRKWIDHIEKKYGKKISQLDFKDINKYYTAQGEDRVGPVLVMQDGLDNLPKLIDIGTADPKKGFISATKNISLKERG